MKTIVDPINKVPPIRNSDIHNKIIISRSEPSYTHWYTSYAVNNGAQVYFRGYYNEQNGTISPLQTWNDNASTGYDLLDLIINESTYYPNTTYYIIENKQDLEFVIDYLDIKQKYFLYEIREIAKKIFKDQTTRRQP